MKALTILAAAMASLIPLHAGNIVLNGGFETGDFTSWNVTLAHDGSDLHTDSTSNTGDFSAAFGGTTAGDFDVISQLLSTVSGQNYTFSFFLAGVFGETEGEANVIRPAFSVVDPVGDFQVFWNGAPLLDSPAGNSPGFDFTAFAFNVTATGNDTITFQGYNLPDHFFLDDVSVASASDTPEPATWMFLGLGLTAVFAVRRIRRTATR